MSLEGQSILLQVFQQLNRYGALLARPIISEALGTEKKSIAALLSK